MVEQRYEAVRAVIADGETVTDAAARFGVSRKTMHVWLSRYEQGGLDGLADRSHRPRSCPHQMPAAAEVALVDLRMAHPSWGPRRLSFELGKRGVVVSESAAYRALVRTLYLPKSQADDSYNAGKELSSACNLRPRNSSTGSGPIAG